MARPHLWRLVHLQKSTKLRAKTVLRSSVKFNPSGSPDGNGAPLDITTTGADMGSHLTPNLLGHWIPPEAQSPREVTGAWVWQTLSNGVLYEAAGGDDPYTLYRAGEKCSAGDVERPTVS